MNKSQYIIARFSSEVSLKSDISQGQNFSRLLNSIYEKHSHHNTEIKTKRLNNQFILKTPELKISTSILSKTFGLGSYSPVITTSANNQQTLTESCLKTFAPLLKNKSFAVRVKKMGARKSLPKPTALERTLGEVLLPFARKVDLTQPEVTCHIEVHEEQSYLFTEKIKGLGGFPVGYQGRALCLISGGVDSTVAAWKALKKGLAVDYVFFNLGGQAYERKVLQVTKVLNDLWGTQKAKIIVCPFNAIKEELQNHSQPSLRQILLKQAMLKIADQIRSEGQYKALIMGDSIAQVSSQTLDNIRYLDKSCASFIIRPLISMDKEEIMEISRKIGTYKLHHSIHEFCNITHGSQMLTGKTGRLLSAFEELPLNLFEETYKKKKEIFLHQIDQKFLVSKYLYQEQWQHSFELIDCQSSQEQRIWSHPHSKKIPMEHLQKNYSQHLNKNQQYLIYCRFGTKSPYLAEFLQHKGYSVYAFKGPLSQVRKLKPPENRSLN